MEWQPIETAPKDGTPILLFAAAKGASALVRVIGWYLRDHGWIELAFHRNQPVGLQEPLAWMSLPDFPSLAARGDQ